MIHPLLLLTLLHLGCTSDPEPPPSPPLQQQTEALYRQALTQVQQRDLDAAAATFERLLQLDPAHYEAHVGLGEIHLRNRRLPQALAHFDPARQAQPQRLEARFQAARTLRGLQRTDEARALFESLAVDFPDHLPTRMLLADLLMTVAPPDPAAALEHYEAILQRRPDHLQAAAGAAASRLRLGQFSQAAAELEALVYQDAANPHLTFLLGVAYHWQEDYTAAVTAYKRALDALPPDAPQRPIRLWNLSLAYRRAHGTYPGDLEPPYRLSLAALDAESPVHFTDVAPMAGVAKRDRGRGSAWGDFDEDGDLDLFSVGIQTPHALYRNDGSTFTDIAAAAGLDDARGGWAAIGADYDNDGDLDLYVTRDAWEGSAPNSLYGNNGDGTFQDIAGAAGVAGAGDSFTAAWGDFDNDGDLDLYVAEGITGKGTPNSLYGNNGDGTFQDVAAAAGVAHPGKSLGVAWGDIDQDGDLDLYVADVGGPNALYRNNGKARFTDITAAAGVAAPRRGGYVALFFDADNDADLDLYVSGMSYYEHFVASRTSGHQTHPSRGHLYRNEGANRFTDIAPQSGLALNFGTMGAGYGDVDYDGRIDLYLANGGPLMGRFEPNILFHNRGDRFADITAAAGVGTLGKGHGVAFADYDDDGDLDLYAGVGGHYPGDLWPNSLYRNDGHANHWLYVDLEGRSSNRSAIGTQLLLKTATGTQLAQISGGDGFGSSNSLVSEFGLGAANRAQALEIRWPSGHIEHLADLEADRILSIIEKQ